MIPRIKTMQVVSANTTIQQEIKKLSDIYALEVLPLKTRVVVLPGRKCKPQIVDTFLGYELKAAHRRITCPDMRTARYLKVFMELGMPSICTPYDPTHTTLVVPELERSLKQIKTLLHDENHPHRIYQSKLRNIYKRIRHSLIKAERNTQSTLSGS